MTLPTQTWRASKSYILTTTSPVSILQSIKDAFTAEDTIGSNLWTVELSSLGAAPNYITFKRKGSPSGTLATFRGALFGGSVANVNNRSSNPTTATTGQLWAGGAETIGSTPPSDYSAGTAFPSANQLGFCLCSTLDVSSWNIKRLTIFETDEMLLLYMYNITGTDNGMWMLFGRCIEDIDGNGLWTVAVSGNEVTPTDAFPTVATTSGSGTTVGSLEDRFYVATIGINGSSGVRSSLMSFRASDGTHYMAGKVRDRMDQDIVHYGTDITLDKFIAYPIELGYVGHNFNSNAGTIYALGVLRQIRNGPRIAGRKIIRDRNSVIRGYAINAGYSGVSRSLFLDNTA